MDIGIVSIRYAKALLQFAMENHEEDGVYREMSAMADVFMKLPALQKAMQNPVLTSQQTETLLGSACGFWRQPDSINAKVHQTCCEQEAGRLYDVYCACVHNTLS